MKKLIVFLMLMGSFQLGASERGYEKIRKKLLPQRPVPQEVAEEKRAPLPFPEVHYEGDPSGIEFGELDTAELTPRELDELIRGIKEGELIEVGDVTIFPSVDADEPTISDLGPVSREPDLPALSEKEPVQRELVRLESSISESQLDLLAEELLLMKGSDDPQVQQLKTKMSYEERYQKDPDVSIIPFPEEGEEELRASVPGTWVRAVSRSPEEKRRLKGLVTDFPKEGEPIVEGKQPAKGARMLQASEQRISPRGKRESERFKALELPVVPTKAAAKSGTEEERAELPEKISPKAAALLGTEGSVSPIALVGATVVKKRRTPILRPRKGFRKRPGPSVVRARRTALSDIGSEKAKKQRAGVAKSAGWVDPVSATRRSFDSERGRAQTAQKKSPRSSKRSLFRSAPASPALKRKGLRLEPASPEEREALEKQLLESL